MGPYGSNNSKFNSFYKSQPVFKLVLNFPSNGPHKTTFGIFELLSFQFLTSFSENFKFTIVAYMEKLETSIIWKTSDGRAKQSEIWDSRVAVQQIWGTFGLVAFKVILRSFSALSIFRNLGLMIRDRRNHFEWL